MKKPTGKIKFAYETINKLEIEVNKQREIISQLINVLDPFIISCYKGCTKDELNGFRINAESLLKSLKHE